MVYTAVKSITVEAEPSLVSTKIFRVRTMEGTKSMTDDEAKEFAFITLNV